MSIPAQHWQMRDEPLEGGWRVTATHRPTGISAQSHGTTHHGAADMAKWKVKQRLAALQRLDLTDPRRALEELATVPTLRERAEAALRVLDEAPLSDPVAIHPNATMTIGGVTYGFEHLPHQGKGPGRAQAIEDARDEARRLLAEVLL